MRIMISPPALALILSGSAFIAAVSAPAHAQPPVPTPAQSTAQTPMTGAEFEAYSTGKTLFYNSGGLAYGIEQYLPGREVRWAFVGDECKDGYWYEEAEFICFVYEDFPDPQCWTFFDTPSGVQARFQGDTESEPLVAVGQSQEPLACAGPDLGV